MERQEFSPAGQSQSVDLVSTSLLAAHIALITAERQALWQRYTALLLANAILLGFFTQLQAPTKLQVYFASGFGVVLCLAWLVSTISGMRLARLRSNPSALDADPLFIDIRQAELSRGEWFFRMAIVIIGLFMLGYGFLLAHYLYYMFFFIEGRR
jgi:uncharacterized membrane protein YczE